MHLLHRSAGECFAFKNDVNICSDNMVEHFENPPHDNRRAFSYLFYVFRPFACRRILFTTSKRESVYYTSHVAPILRSLFERKVLAKWRREPMRKEGKNK